VRPIGKPVLKLTESNQLKIDQRHQSMISSRQKEISQHFDSKVTVGSLNLTSFIDDEEFSEIWQMFRKPRTTFSSASPVLELTADSPESPRNPPGSLVKLHSEINNFGYGYFNELVVCRLPSEVKIV